MTIAVDWDVKHQTKQTKIYQHTAQVGKDKVPTEIQKHNSMVFQ